MKMTFYIRGNISEIVWGKVCENLIWRRIHEKLSSAGFKKNAKKLFSESLESHKKFISSLFLLNLPRRA